MGLQICRSSSDITSAFRSVIDRSETLFGNAGMFAERFIEESRHIEVQVFGDGKGGAVGFGERECSIQRRHQKVVEECPSPFVQRRPGEFEGGSVGKRAVWWDAYCDGCGVLELRKRLVECAVALASSVSYGSAGTIE